jgi:DNA-binding response OmpR family regulator
MKALLVEDDDSTREVLQVLLETKGYQVSAHATAESALVAYQTFILLWQLLTYGCRR